VQKNLVPPVKPKLWTVSVGAMSDCSGDMHKSSRRVWAKVPSVPVEPTVKKKASVHWYFNVAERFSELEMTASVEVISTG
jgi:hypothetical protein